MNLTLVEVFVDATGWTLAHFLWQGVAVALLAIVASQLTRHRYFVNCVAMVLLFCVAISTFVMPIHSRNELMPSESAIGTTIVSDMPTSDNSAIASSQGASHIAERGQAAKRGVVGSGPSATTLGGWRFWIVGIWLCGVGLFALRFWRDWSSVRQLRRDARILEPNIHTGAAVSKRWRSGWVYRRQRECARPN